MEPTIYKPSIYKGAGVYNTGAEGGGGGGEIAAIRCVVRNVSRYIEIPCNVDTRHTFEIGVNVAFSGSDRSGLIQGRGNRYYPEFGLRVYGPNTTSFGFSVESDSSDKAIIQTYPNQYRFYHIKAYSNESNTILEATDIKGNLISNSGTLINLYPITKFRLFIENWTDSDTCPGNEIYYFRVSSDDNTKIDLVPSEENGVAGFLDKVSNTFYGPNVNDGSLEAVKTRAPL